MKYHYTLVAITLALLSSSPLWAEPAETTDDDSDLRLQLARVSLYTETGRYDDAYALIETLKEEYPDNPRVLASEADLNLSMGNSGRGMAALNRAIAIDPGNEDILERQRSVALSQGPFVGGGYDFRRISQAYENMEHVDAQVNISSSLSIGTTLENNDFRGRTPIIYPDGRTSTFVGDKQRGTVTLNKVFESGNEATAAVYGNNDTAGGGLQYRMWDHQGSTTLQLNANRPVWDYPETVAEDGTKDNVRLERRQVITNHLEATLSGVYNNYNLRDDRSAAQAGGWDLNISYTIPFSISEKKHEDVILGAYYTGDAEYFSGVDHRMTPGGIIFSPLPVASYEIHALNASVGSQIASSCYVEAHGGYAIDRMTEEKGPVFGGSLNFSLTDALGFELHGFRTLLGGVNGSEKEEQVGGGLKWRL
jgi:hypothetical protein